MAQIVYPLDNILSIVNELINNSHTNRRGSNLDSAFERIINNVNEAKNNIIKHLIDKNSKNEILEKPTFTEVLKSHPKNNIIVKVDTKKPSKEDFSNFETNVFNALKEQNSTATVLKTSATENGNFVVKFKANDKIDEIKNKLSSTYGKSVKAITPFNPKIKVVSVPSHVDTSDPINIVQNVVTSNEFLKNEYEKDNECLKFLFYYNVGENKTLIFKCSPVIRQILKSNGDAIKLNYKMCKLYDRHHVLQCSKCCLLGHSSKNCKSTSLVCTFCGEGHSFKDCTAKDDKSLHKCHNCFNAEGELKENANTHNSFDSNCPLKINMLNKLIARTNNGVEEKT